VGERNRTYFVVKEPYATFRHPPEGGFRIHTGTAE
jgi:hypothetical protein